MTELKTGTLLCWRGDGFLFQLLSSVLSIFDSTWRNRTWKPWHMAMIVGRTQTNDWRVFEATMPRTRTMPLSTLEKIYGQDYRAYEWFALELPQDAVDKWVADRQGAKYDVLIYFLTIAQYLIRKWTKKQMPRLLDEAYDCWELAEEFCECFGRPWKYTHSNLHCYPMISEFMNEVEG